jgi:hypothetical protein
MLLVIWQYSLEVMLRRLYRPKPISSFTRKSLPSN